ncbi:unnamed protein product, partial [Laminaria digitata]
GVLAPASCSPSPVCGLRAITSGGACADSSVMSSVAKDLELLKGVYDANVDLVKAALEAGASVNGFPQTSLITTAAVAGDAGMVGFLLKRGADPNGTTKIKLPCAVSGEDAAPGERALHIAARSGNVEVVRLLLKKGRADPNATDYKRRTPLLVAAKSRHARVEVVRLLLEAGTDLTLADDDGHIPLHYVALEGRLDLLDIVYDDSREEKPSSASSFMLNQCTTTGETPLFMACAGGSAGMVSRLLSLGAVQGATPNERRMCPLMVAARRGFVDVVRVLINEGGLGKAFGDEKAVVHALEICIRFRYPRILRLLLDVEGEAGRAKWANTNFIGRQPLHDGTGYCNAAAVSMLLGAGADETALDMEGLTPAEGIGLNGQLLTTHLGLPYPMDQGQKAAIQRMLLRCPAYRARSWAWPCDAD